MSQQKLSEEEARAFIEEVKALWRADQKAVHIYNRYADKGVPEEELQKLWKQAIREMQAEQPEQECEPVRAG